MKNRIHTRRRFLEISGAAALAAAAPLHMTALTSGPSAAASTAALNAALQRLLGEYAKQVHLRVAAQSGAESFHISGSTGNILVEGSSPSAVMMGVNWYLKYVAGVSISWNGDCLNRLPKMLPAPATPIMQTASVPHRFALNDTNDGYTGPYWRWEQWERMIDVLALHGINEVLVYMGAEAVYQQTFRKFGYTDEELRAWFPTPAHQPWWLLQNLSGWVGPTVPQHLIDARAELGAKITRRLRELGMVPVFPGYYGMVPDNFAAKNAGANVIPQGDWLGLKRPDWLNPTSEIFARVAEEFYRAQERVLGPSTMFKMDPLHEGGKQGGVDLGRVADAIAAALERAHPGATWAILGWQSNPKHELLAGIRDKSKVLILDGQSERFAYKDRETEWDSTPYAFGSIWNFGGHTAIGANAGVWNERYFLQLAKAGSKLQGIAVMPEASCNNPAAFALLTEMAWRHEQLDLPKWFADWAAYRYGGRDANAARAWEVLRATAYDEKAGEWSESHDNLFSTQPSLTANSGASFSPHEARYDLAAFAKAIGPLLDVRAELRASSAYRYDLVDVARQTLADQSRVMLPKIQAAYTAKDAAKFRELTAQWMEKIALLNKIVGTDEAFLFGPWLAAARAAGKTTAEQHEFEFDARSLLVEWGPAASAPTNIHDYANREWNGLLEFYAERWKLYFDSLQTAIEKNEPANTIDWFAVHESWAKRTNRYAERPEGDAYAVVRGAIAAITTS
ncbi:alpha-N-acetylglucosaminidase [Terracidiphilus gabretensis]|uniref:alpha-N-acetylglucosaminidase n=1 Tax=Terracidiphilus gabretensis TaxID=1577687 RepID=UPI00071B6B33|nr:alpha-N-acetylglucosaminidase [Terracidiphilus gabretensis]